HVPESLVAPDEPALLVDMRDADGGELDRARVANLAFAQPILESATLRDVVDRADDRRGLTVLIEARLDQLLDELLASISEHDSALHALVRRRSRRHGPLTVDQYLAVGGMDLGNEVLERGWIALRIFLENSIQLLRPPTRVGCEVPLPVADLGDTLRFAIA